MSSTAWLLGAFVAFASQDPVPIVDALASGTNEFVAGLRDPDPESRERAAMMLALVGPAAEAAVPALVLTLRDSSPRVRAFAALALASISPKSLSVRQTLESVLRNDPEGITRSSAAAALAKIASPESVEPLSRALRDVDARTRLEAVQAIAAIETPAARRAIPAVKELTKDPDPEVRGAVSALLKKLSKK